MGCHSSAIIGAPDNELVGPSFCWVRNIEVKLVFVVSKVEALRHERKVSKGSVVVVLNCLADKEGSIDLAIVFVSVCSLGVTPGTSQEALLA